MNEFQGIYEEMKLHQLKVPSNKISIQIPGAKDILKNAMEYFLGMEGKKLVWLPEYDKVSDWLENNEGRGLFLYGNCGTGKTFMTRYAITAILLKYLRLVVSSFDMVDVNKTPEIVLQKRIICLDDTGTEDISVRYGEKRSIVPEILDATEKYGKLLIMTSNLGAEDLIKKYGNRAFDRILAVTKRIEFNGKSFRD